jgi:hypothetical protein
LEPTEGEGNAARAKEAEAAAFAAEVARLRQGRVPGATGRLRDLFDFLADRGPASEPATQPEISAAVFGEAAPDADDATVRVYVHRLRRRLEEHYAQEPNRVGPRLEVPAGVYALRFALAEESAGAPEEAAPQPPPVPVRAGRAGRWAALVVLALAAGLLAGWALFRPAPPSANVVWNPLLASERPVLLVLGDYYIYGEIDPLAPEEGRLIRDFRVNSPGDLERMRSLFPERFGGADDVGLNYLPFSVAYALETVEPLLAGHRKDVRLIAASELQPDMLNQYDIVYVGLLSGMGLLEELSFMGSGFATGESYDELIDVETGRHFVSGEARSLPSQAYYRDYAFLSRYRAPGGALVTVIAGSRDTGLRAISAILREGELPADLVRAAQGGDAFEALFEITGQQGADLRDELLIARARPDDEL